MSTTAHAADTLANLNDHSGRPMLLGDTILVDLNPAGDVATCGELAVRDGELVVLTGRSGNCWVPLRGAWVELLTSEHPLDRASRLVEAGWTGLGSKAASRQALANMKVS